jgi:hypothetical protein
METLNTSSAVSDAASDAVRQRDQMIRRSMIAADKAGIPESVFDDLGAHSGSIARLIGPIAGELHDYVSNWPKGWRIVVSGGDEQLRARVAHWLAALALIHRSALLSCDDILVRRIRMASLAPYLSDKFGAAWQAQVARIRSPRVLVLLELSPQAMPVDRFGGSVMSAALSQRNEVGKSTIITVATDEVIDRDRLGDEAHNAIYGGEHRRQAIGVRIQEIA